MATINLKMAIDYNDESKTIDNYEIMEEYTIGEVSVIVATFKQCLKDWGYEVKIKED